MIKENDKILIVGASGFLGKYINNFLLNKKVILYKPTSNQFNLLNFNTIEQTQNYLNNLICGNFKFDYIFNCSVYFKPGNFISHGDMYIYNQIMNDNFLRYIKEYQQQAIIVTFGTDAAYEKIRYSNDECKEDLYLKGEPQKDYYGYSLSKRNLYIGLNLLKSQYNINFFHFPLISLYGSDYKKNDNHLIHDILKKIIRAKYHNEEAKFFGNGLQIREITYVNDLVENIFKIIDNEECKDFNIFNLGSDNKRKTIKEYIKIISEKLDYDFNKCFFDDTVKIGINSKFLYNYRAKKYIDYSDTKFEDTLDNIINYSLELYK